MDFIKPKVRKPLHSHGFGLFLQFSFLFNLKIPGWGVLGKAASCCLSTDSSLSWNTTKYQKGSEEESCGWLLWSKVAQIWCPSCQGRRHNFYIAAEGANNIDVASACHPTESRCCNQNLSPMGMNTLGLHEWHMQDPGGRAIPSGIW